MEEKRVMKCVIKHIGLLCIPGLFFVIGCATKAPEPEYIARPEQPDFELKVCIDGMACPKDLAKPFIKGGPDYRQPTPDVVGEWKKYGHYSRRTRYSTIVKKFKKQGYVLPFIDGTENCKGHVLSGGNCLAAPPPGTPDYERLLRGAANEK